MPEDLPTQPTGKTTPTVTVAMPIYNAGKYLRLAVQSIIHQSFTDWELLIIDDGSTDNAVATLADIQDPRIRILSDGQNKGLAARLNEVIDLAQGCYLARMDQDDISYPERFSRQVQALQNDLTLDLVATRAITIDENNVATGIRLYDLSHEEICARPWRGFYLPHPTWMGRIEWFRKHRYASPAPYFCEDQELLLRSYCVSRYLTLNEILFAYRVPSKVNFGKLVKTRHAVKNIQLLHFSRNRQWVFGVCSFLLFVARLTKDYLMNAITGSPWKRSKVDSTYILEWEEISKRISKSM
jgi:glycosyltransferase involved in cell wall biosynthesis